MTNGKPVSRMAGAVIVLIWLILVVLLAIWTYETFASDCTVPYSLISRHEPKVLTPQEYAEMIAAIRRELSRW